MRDWANGLTDEAVQAPLSYTDMRGNAYQQKGELDKAIADYSQAIQLDASLFEAWRKRGWARNRAGDYKGALEDFDKAIQLEPRNAMAWNGRGAARDKAGAAHFLCFDDECVDGPRGRGAQAQRSQAQQA